MPVKREILFVDDEQSRVAPHIEVLRRHGVAVHIANSVASGVRIIEASRQVLCCAVVDVLMPPDPQLPNPGVDGAGGLQIYWHLRSLPGRESGLPVIFLSVMSSFRIAPAVGSGDVVSGDCAVSHLLKPADPLDLLERVMEMSDAYLGGSR